MTNIASKNLYELLGNDPELDPNREPEPPTKAIDKPVARSGKRNAGAEAPSGPAAESRPQGGGRRGGRHEVFSGNEAAFRGNYNNRGRNDDGLRQDRHPDRTRDANDTGYRGRGRGSRGGRGARGGGGGRPADDRHSKTGIAEHDKQAAHGWGGTTGADEWNDEKAGDAIAKEEEKDGFDTSVPPPVNADGLSPDADGNDAEEEPEDKSKSFAAYLAEQAEKKLHLGGVLEARKPNEGSSKKFPEGKAFERENDTDFIAGAGAKAGRVREKKQKEVVQLDDERLHKAPDVGGGRGGRGRGRGEGRGDGGSFRGRGDGARGDRPERGERRGGGGGRGRGDGERRGGFRGDGERRGGFRGGRGGPGANVNVNDQSAFPSLGS